MNENATLTDELCKQCHANGGMLRTPLDPTKPDGFQLHIVELPLAIEGAGRFARVMIDARVTHHRHAMGGCVYIGVHTFNGQEPVTAEFLVDYYRKSIERLAMYHAAFTKNFDEYRENQNTE